MANIAASENAGTALEGLNEELFRANQAIGDFADVLTRSMGGIASAVERFARRIDQVLASRSNETRGTPFDLGTDRLAEFAKNAAIVGVAAGWEARREIVARVNAEIVDTVEQTYGGVKTWLVDEFDLIIAGVKENLDKVAGVFKGLYDKVVGNSIVPDMIGGIGLWFGKLGETMAAPAAEMAGAVRGSFERMGSSVARSISNMVKAGKFDLDSLRRTAASVIGDLRDMIVERAIAKPLEGFFGSILGGIFGGAKARGGPVSPRKAFLVGEQGPELFIPPAPGRIVPNGSFGVGRASVGKGAVVINYNVDARGADAAAIRRLEQNQRQFYKAMPAIAVSSVLRHMARNPGF